VIAVAKKQRSIPISEVSRIFDANCIRHLAIKLPSHADFERFAEGIRYAAASYATNASARTGNEMHHEVRALFKAASLKRPCYREVAALLDGLSPQVRNLLNGRSARLGRPGLPAPSALLDKALRTEACELIVTLCRVGIGRGGRALLHAPDLRRNFRKRQAEDCFVTDIRLAWLEATGEQPAVTVNPADPSSFAKMVQKCFYLALAHANAIEAINRLDSKRRWMEEHVPLSEDASGG
jgi:hypothetical protein